MTVYIVFDDMMNILKIYQSQAEARLFLLETLDAEFPELDDWVDEAEEWDFESIEELRNAIANPHEEWGEGDFTPFNYEIQSMMVH